MSGADRVQQARERAEATLNAEWFEPVGVTMRENLAHDVLFLADRVATLETALRKIASYPCMPLEHEPAAYMKYIAGGALAGSEGDSATKTISRIYNCGHGKLIDCATHGTSDNPVLACPECLPMNVGNDSA